MEGSEEGRLDARHVLLCEEGVVLVAAVLMLQQGHEVCRNHEQAVMHGGGAWGGWLPRSFEGACICW